jgi:hypothetical protein
MGLDIHGWIEITYASEGEAQDDTMWMGVTRLSPLVDVPDKVSEGLFGFSKRAVAKPQDFRPVASGRGMPPACSQEVRDDVARIREHEQQYGPGEFGGFTYVSYAELTRVNWESIGVQPRDSEWSTVFRVLEALGSRFDHEKIRIVTWWAW